MNRKIIIFLVLSLVLGAVGYGWHHVRVEKMRRHVFGGGHTLQAFVAADLVTAQRLHTRNGRPKGSDRLEDYEQGPPVMLVVRQVQEIKHILLRPSSYDLSFRSEKSCVLDYGVLLTFRSSQESIRVALCFQCMSLAVYSADDDRAPPLGSGEFDPARKDLTALIKSIFVNDSEIQQLR